MLWWLLIFATPSPSSSFCSPGYELVSGQCTECGVGKYENLGVCTVCPAGKYAEFTQSLSCTDCDRGRYIADDGVNWRLHSIGALCFECPAGKYSDTMGAAECHDCTPGRYTGYPGNTQCHLCYSGAAGGNGSVACDPCTPGSGSNMDYTACTECEAGKYSWDGYACYDCAWGQVSPAGATACTQCATGKFAGPATNNTCQDCPAGRYSSVDGTDCFQCMDGSFSVAGGATCELCSPGKFALMEASQCEDCPAGQTSDTGSSSCTFCDWGKVSAAGDRACSDCEAGKYANGNATACLDCDAGTYKGTFDQYCSFCSFGYAAAAGSGSCTPCPAGRYALADRSACEDCPNGTYYSDSSGAPTESCWPCWAVVSEDRTKCDSCAAGKYLTGSSVKSCADCEPGRFTSYAGYSSYDGTNCQACPQGRYTGAAGSTVCETCPGGATLGTASASYNDCILPEFNQTLECPKGKSCAVILQGSLQWVHRITVKHTTCETAGAPTQNTGPYGYGGAVPGYRRLQDGSVVSGFGSNGFSSVGSSNYSWEGTVSAEVGIYRLCWCGGVTTQCANDYEFPVDAGSMTVLGPFPNQAFACVLGRQCVNVGPLQGLGLSGNDLLTVRQGCVLELAFLFSVSLDVTAANPSGDVVLYFGQATAEALAYAAGDYSLCWCSSQGQSCSDMQASSSLYLESLAGILAIQGPVGGESIYCYKGQTCQPTLSNGGTVLLAGDRLSFMQQCGSGNFLSGLPEPGYAETVDGSSFTFLKGDLQSEPGMFRVCWCREDASLSMDCTKGSDFNVVAGLFLAVGPYSGQTSACTHGQGCVVTGIRGVSLAATDKLAAMSSCRLATFSATFPSPPVLSSTLVNGAYQFDLGQLPLEGVPEELELCWCASSPSSCSNVSEFRAVAMTVSVACAAGWYDLIGATTACARCPVGHYCPGGWPADLMPCPAGSISPADAITLAACECREGYYWDAGLSVCLACAEGTFKDTIGNSNCLGSCPTGTTSSHGAISLRECYCVGDTIDIDAAADIFACTDLVALQGNFSADLQANDQVDVYTFTGSFSTTEALTDASLQQVRTALDGLLGLGADDRASLQLQPSLSAYVNYTVASTEQALAQYIQAKFGEAFAAWAFQEMKGTVLDGSHAVASSIGPEVLECPTGLAFSAGQISGLENCACPPGLQPAVPGSSGLLSGCSQCPIGTYKSSIADAECTACPSNAISLTTLQLGAVSHAACTCSAGHVNLDPTDPSSCQACGEGSFCLGGSHREACGASQTTSGITSSSSDQCLCSAGSTLSSGLCSACLAGRFKADVSNDACGACAAGRFSGLGQAGCEACGAGQYSLGGTPGCEACPLGCYSEQTAATSAAACLPCATGKWSNRSGVALEAECAACVAGSTTLLDGAHTLELCIRPHAGQSYSCTSGMVCVVDGVTGHSLQDGHRLAISASDCSGAKSPLAGITTSGISKAASSTGSRYVWGDTMVDFIPQGGLQKLCWCANVGTLVCDDLNANFLLPVGELLIVGPVENAFECVRGRDCLGLQPFRGYGLTPGDQLRLQRDSCGSSTATEISPANPTGQGAFQALATAGNLVELILSFGTSDADNDFHLQIDASQAGYWLCWCAAANTCSDPAAHAVYAGRLSILGPSTNQERSCAVGQACAVTGILGAGMGPGDLLRILSDCGRGASILGFPGGGVLNSSDGSNFAFLAADTTLLSVPGIFRMCFCRPSSIETCEASSGFIARVGLMTASGPFSRATTCALGSSCSIALSGVSLSAGDRLWVALGTCGEAVAIGDKGYAALANPLIVEDSANGLTVNLGILPFSALPGVYQLCWCPVTADCSSTASFRAPAGSLQADCPAGSFATGPQAARVCERCTRGYFCGGGQPQSATRVACSVGRNTLDLGSTVSSACVCDRGYRLEVASGSCLPCALGYYKDVLGDLEQCSACQNGSTTFRTGAVSNSSCIQAVQGQQLATEASVPAVSFNFSMSIGSTTDPERLRQQLIELFIASLSASTRIDPAAIQIDIPGLAARRLFDASNIVITIKTKTLDEAQTAAEDLDATVVTNEITSAVQQHPSLSTSGLQLQMTSAPTTTVAVVKCPASRSIPPGVPIQSADDCQCSPGYGFNPVTGTCDACGQGEYKAEIADSICSRCPQYRSTLLTAATSLEQCECEVGLYDDGVACASCPLGFYCPGSGAAVPCPDNSTTTTEGRSPSDCTCNAGFYFVSVNGSQGTTCRPCDRGSYKPNVGNAECSLNCPTNADSNWASTSLSDCFCEPGFYASVDRSTNQLARCIPCTFQGLDCRGGFENQSSNSNGTADRVHALPISLPGFFQTGLTTAVECDVLLADGSACRGGEACVAGGPACHGRFGNSCGPGSEGMLCGACPRGWARDSYPEACQPCPPESVSVLIAGVLSDIFQKTSLNFVVAVMAATSAVRGGSKLHTSMIRIGTQWLAACSVLTEFNLDRLPGFGWSQEQEKLDQLKACADANVTDCEISQEASKFPWPKEVTELMDNVFALMGIVPSLASLDFSAQCHGEQLTQGDKTAKLVAPGFYFVVSPVIAMAGVTLMCALVAYGLVPLARRMGIDFNEMARKRKKREAALKRLQPALEPVLQQYGLTWGDLEESEILEETSVWGLEHASIDPTFYLSGKLAFCRVLAMKMCLHKAKQDAQHASLCAEAGLTWDDLLARPELLFQDLSSESLREAILDPMSPSFIERMVLRAQAWSLRGSFRDLVEPLDLPLDEVVLRIAAAHESPTELRLAAPESLRRVAEEVCSELRRQSESVVIHASTEETELKVLGADLESLDFGLFSSYPKPLLLLKQCVPVFWVTLLAMWPELLSTFLKMIWCTPVSEDNEQGFTVVRQRLLPHPDVVCWSADHFLLSLLAIIGLGVWCVGVPLALFLRLYCLKDRQSPENFRKYGYFIQGFEPQYWWWDIVVKRFDILLMNLITYTSIATDEKAKLLVFPIISGCALGLCAWCQPFTNTQAEILDFLEMCLLSFRFCLFSMVAIMLIFNPPRNATWALAGLLVFLLVIVCGYFAVHVAAQFLKGSAQDMAESEGEEEGSPEAKRDMKHMRRRAAKQQPMLLRMASGTKKLLISLALPLFIESDEEKFFLRWSIHSANVELVSAAARFAEGKPKSTRFRYLVKGLKAIRASVLRFGTGVQRQIMVKAISEFSALWLDEFDQGSIPMDLLQVLCALTATSKHVPHKTPIPETGLKWKRQVDSLLESHRESKQEEHAWYVSLDDAVTATHRLQKLGQKDAVLLVERVQALLHLEKRRHLEIKLVKALQPPKALVEVQEDAKPADEGRVAGPETNEVAESVPLELEDARVWVELKECKEMAVQTRVKSAAQLRLVGQGPD